MDTNKILNQLALISLLSASLLLAIGEMEMFPRLEGGTEAYVLQLITVAMTLVAIPLSLRMMNTRYLRSLVRGQEGTYRRWSMIRLGLLESAILVGVLAYDLIQDTSMLFCAGIGVISLMYIWPTRERLESELEASKGGEQ